ncbi:MAG: hypothetical protein PHP73_07170 [Candidatus Omnitrophica bacterium]|nr:hypothetical protein [Candidatus Omnitrophota bacterium]MDD5477065.1 hypothetical protein [Candidatus Omnitrophota bacterium]
MKKKISILLILFIFFSVRSYALENGLFEMRNKISLESKQIKALFLQSKDIVLMSSMWDSSVMTMMQLDAYFYMVGIFNSVKIPNEDAVNYLINWLKIIKSTSELNIKSLDAVTQTLEPKTKVCKERLRSDFSELNKNIDSELSRVSVLKKATKAGKAP